MNAGVQDKTIVRGILREHIQACWPSVSVFIQDGMKNLMEDMTLADVYERLCEGKMQLWTGTDDRGVVAVLITSVSTNRQGKICHLVGVSGVRMDEWVEFMKTIKAWAKEKNCYKIVGQGRDGWERVLEPFGFKKKQVVVECGL